MLKTLYGSLVGALLLVPPAAQAATADVRVEGAGTTPVALAHVTLPAGGVGKPGQQTCPGATALGALDTAVAGDWDGTYYDGFGYSLDSIRGEAHTFGSGAFWSVYVNDAYTNEGVCTAAPDGAEVVLFAACDSIYGSPPPELPCYGRDVTDNGDSWTVAGVLSTSAPGTVAPGTPFGVTVREARATIDKTTGTGTSQLRPSQGASAGGATTDAGGNAAVTLNERGVQTFRVTKADYVPDTVEVCVTDGADGFCGTSKPGEAPAVQPPCVHDGDDGRCGTPDHRAAYTFITSIGEGQRFKRRRAPRELSGRVDSDASGTKDVRMRLTRTRHRRCTTFDAEALKWRHRRTCGVVHGKWFSASTSADWRYLLPRRLRRGRYVLEVRAVDGAGNMDVRRDRGRNVVVFFVG